MTTVTMKANDTLHISEVSQHSLQPGEKFEVSETAAKDLEDRGLATRVKAAPAHENKMEAAPENKGAKGKKA